MTISLLFQYIILLIFLHELYSFQISINLDKNNHYDVNNFEEFAKVTLDEFKKCLPIFYKCLSWNDIHEERFKVCNNFYDINFMKNFDAMKEIYYELDIEIHRCWKFINPFTPNMDDFFYAN
ncbi:Hypothetical protein SRAE_2000054300 [Strongyloides ratti]|uniref:Uncharacterized protein n=1 Tax=Strongyloides ratti TaxID=34506 RepID=A0A090LCM2_STRRB|nr:Hypothetical protein SRAE_2000054300 [Strongyloides ratti]CEF65868.1 Hypothetical protein SRAE_2000054300 [Strongyloides ratti]